MQDLQKELARQLDADRVVVVAGAGVSVAATEGDPVASWKGLLEHGIEYCLRNAGCEQAWVNGMRSLLEARDLETVSDGIERMLRPGEEQETFARWLGLTIGQLRAKDTSLLEAIHALGAPVITTNYDSLLLDSGRRPPILWSEPSVLDRWARGQAEGVFHMHGHWESPGSVVLGARSYDRIRRSEQAQATLRALATTHTLVFVGCGQGLQDPNAGALRKWMEEVFSGAGHRHLLLARASEVEDIRREMPPEGRIEVVSYGREFQDLAPWLESVAGMRTPEPRLEPPGPGGEGARTEADATTGDRSQLPPGERAESTPGWLRRGLLLFLPRSGAAYVTHTLFYLLGLWTFVFTILAFVGLPSGSLWGEEEMSPLGILGGLAIVYGLPLLGLQRLAIWLHARRRASL